MKAKSQQPKGHGRILSALNVAIEGLNLMKELSSPTPAYAIIGTITILLIMMRVGFLRSVFVGQSSQPIQDSKVNRTDYIELGLACADICTALDRGMEGRRADQLSGSVLEAIEQLTT